MKIKIINLTYGKLYHGSIVDAAISSSGNLAVCFSDDEVYTCVHSSNFEIVLEEEKTPAPVFYSLHQMLGQDVQRIEFK